MEKKVKRSIKLSKHAPSKRVLQINISHRASEAIAPSDFTIVTEGEEWVVASSNGIGSYVINKSQTMCEEDCMKCALCSICIHSFKCTCTDNVINKNICKHIHACCRVFNLTSSPDSDSDVVADENSLIEQTKVNMNVGNREILARKVSTFLDLLSKADLNDSNFKLVESKLDDAIGLLKNMLSTRQETNSECESRQNRINVNSKIKPQVRLFSLKKKGNNSSKSLKKPTFSKSVSIIEGLVSETQVVNNHTENDHTYW